jgi:hypothetical protein
MNDQETPVPEEVPEALATALQGLDHTTFRDLLAFIRTGHKTFTWASGSMFFAAMKAAKVIDREGNLLYSVELIDSALDAEVSRRVEILLKG